MIKLSRIVLSILCLMIAGTIFPANSFAQKNQEVAVKEGSGEVISVDTAAQSLVVKISQDEVGGSSQKVVLVVDSNTMITSQDSTLNISDLKAGNKVTIIYETKDDGTNLAKSIMVR